jgi:surface protein
MASAFDQNIGSWNTAAVKDMSGVRALVTSHASRLCDEAPLVATKHHFLHRSMFQRDILRCGVAWQARRAGLCALRCGRRGAGSQAFYSAKAFNKNIGSWNTAAVTTMSTVRALLPSHACGAAQPTSFSQQWSRPQVVPAQMWAWPTLDVGESQCRCGRVHAQMWVRSSSTVNESGVFKLYL